MLPFFAPLKATRTGKIAIIRQLAIEMWLPLLLALAWTGYSLYIEASTRTIKGFITAFGPSFFLACWAFAQWHRVKKQQKVEMGLEGIEQRLGIAISNFDTRATEILNNVTGGDGYCYVALIYSPPGQYANRIVVSVHGYSLFDLSLTVLDWDTIGTDAETRRTTKLGELQSGVAHMRNIDLGLETGRSRNLKIDFWARNGSWRQHLRIEPKDGINLVATKVERDGVTVFEEVYPDFPREPNGEVDWKEEYPFRVT